jgi:hypothetical protein
LAAISLQPVLNLRQKLLPLQSALLNSPQVKLPGTEPLLGVPNIVIERMRTGAWVCLRMRVAARL